MKTHRKALLSAAAIAAVLTTVGGFRLAAGRSVETAHEAPVARALPGNLPANTARTQSGMYPPPAGWQAPEGK